MSLSIPTGSTLTPGARELALWLRTLAALTENRILMLSTHVAAQNYNSSFRRSGCSLLASMETHFLWVSQRSLLQARRWGIPCCSVLSAGASRLGSKQESKSIEHTFIQVEVQKHVPNPNAYKWFLQILLLKDESILCLSHHRWLLVSISKSIQVW